MRVTPLLRAWGGLVSALSFSGELRRLRRELNARIDSPEAPGREARPADSGRWLASRRISIAESYIRIVNDLESHHVKARLRALRKMVEVSFRASSLDMPLNTARVQLALVKEAVKSRDDRRRQLELLMDFSESSHGQYQVIRRLLDELNMVELPETGARLRELDAGWDGNVHDSSTSGRKNPTQLLVDAFIKGISELTIACGGPETLDQMRESVEAGRILGIRVRLGVEFSLNRCDRRFHFMALLPPLERGSEVKRYFHDKARVFKELGSGLEANQEQRVAAIRHLIASFNETRLGPMNEGFPDSPLYRLPRLRMRDLAARTQLSRIAKAHLEDYLFSLALPVYLNRLLYLKARSERLHRLRSTSLEAGAAASAAEEAYRRARADYVDLRPETLARRCFPDPEALSYNSAFDNLERMRLLLREAGCGLRVLHPLEHGLEKAREFLESARGLVDEVEIYNIQHGSEGDPGDLLALCRWIDAINRGASERGWPPMIPRCGSDASGRKDLKPGMGFIFADRIGSGRDRETGAAARRFALRHVAVPAPVAALVRARGAPVDLDAGPRGPELFSMGKVASPRPNRVGDEDDRLSSIVSPWRALRYLNPLIHDALRALIAFAVARIFIGDAYALLWLGITGFRNAVADLVASRGARFRYWNVRSVNWDNVARSIFWTGFSVPLLGTVKSLFDGLWPLASQGLLHDAAKFFLISGVNGLYLATHNKLRGFDRRVVRANLFRSVLAWPFATLFSPLGNLIGIPSIVQAKIWSDTVAAFIEGGNKYLKVLRLRRRDLEEIIPRVSAGTKAERYAAIIDLLYLWKSEPRTRLSLAAIVAARRQGPGAGGDADHEPVSALLAALSGRRIDEKLVDFILGEYSPAVAVRLIDLVAPTLPDLRAWLEACQFAPRASFVSAQGPDGS